MLSRILYILAAILCLASCGAREGGSGASMQSGASVAEDGMFAMPQVPESISDPQARADWLLLHFWDNADFSAAGLLKDSVMLEQAMSNYISVMDFCTPEGLDKGITHLLRTSGKASEDVYQRVVDVADLYLWDAESPFRNENYYLPFAEYELARGGDNAERAKARIEEIERNRPGSVAPAFELENIKGGKIFFEPGSESRVTVLMFYEPDCEHCESVVEALRNDAGFSRAVGNGEIRMIAAYLGDDYKLWREHAAKLPQTWETGIDRKGRIDDGELYVVRATPSIYLIDANGKIVLKDSDLAHLGEALSR